MSSEVVQGGGSSAVARSSALMASGTILSRVTGVVRTSAIAAALGFATLADTYSIANSLPNIVYILVAGGAINSVFVPQLVRHMKEDKDGGDGYADRLLTLVGLILLGLTVASVVLAPLIIRLYAPRDWSASDLHVSTLFAYFLLPQIMFYGIYTMFQQVLNARGSFGTPMFAPIINNVVVIVAAVAFIAVAGTNKSTSTISNNEVIFLGAMTTIGVILQAAVLFPAAWRVGYRYRPRRGFRGQGLGKAGSLATWTVGFVLVNQITLLITTRLAAAANVQLTNAGDVNVGFTSYQNAYLTFILPHSVITVSLVTALLPAMSRAAHDLDFAALRAQLSEVMRVTAAVLLPATGLMILLAPTLTQLLFARGSASIEESRYTGYVLIAFVIGLVPFSLYYVLLRGYYSLENTKTPFFLTVALNVINLAFAFTLYFLAPPQNRVIMLALSFALAYTVMLVVSWIVFGRHIGGLDTFHVVRTAVRSLIAALFTTGAAALVFWGMKQVLPATFQNSFIGLCLLLAIPGLVGLAVFLGFAHVMRITEVTALRRFARRH